MARLDTSVGQRHAEALKRRYQKRYDARFPKKKEPKNLKKDDSKT